MNLQNEIWKPVVGYKDGFYDGLYEISNFGKFKMLPRTLNCQKGVRVTKEKIVFGSNSWGYRTVVMKKDRIRLQIGVHILVANAFIPNPENKYSVNHIDGVRSNNKVENLEWATQLEQVHHAIKTGLARYIKGEERSNSIVNENIVKLMRKEYSENRTSYAKIGKKYGLARSTVGHIIRKQKWKHVA